MGFLRKLWEAIARIFSREPTPLRTVQIGDMPERLRDGAIYLVGENDQFWCVALRCPCHCGAVIQLNLLRETRPCWAFELEPGTQLMTLTPSVNRTGGCRSHFILRGGRVHWC